MVDGARASLTGWNRPAVVLALGLVVVAVLCAPAWDYPIFADDYQYGAIGEMNPFEHFGRPHAENGFYRPIAFLAISATQRFFGTHTWPLHLVQYIAHAALGLIVFLAARHLTRSTLAAWLSWAFFVTAQGATHALASNDTLTQILSTAAGFAALYLVLRHTGIESTIRRPAVGPSLSVPLAIGVTGLVALSLWSKESGVAFLALAALALAVAVRRRRITLARTVPIIASTGVVAAAYWLARSTASRASLQFGDGRHDVAVGLVNAKNVGMMLVSAASPLSTVRAYTGAVSGDLLTLALFAALLGCVGALMLAGAGRRSVASRPLVLALVGAAIVVCFPAALQNRVSELYAYNCLPLVAMLTGLGAASLLKSRDSGRRFAIGIVLTAITLAAGAISVHSKARLMRDSGRQAEAVMLALSDHVSRAGHAARIGLVDVHERPSYSVFVMSPFELIGPTAEDDIAERTGRPDVDLEWLSPNVAEQSQGSDGFTELVVFRNGSIEPYRRDAPVAPAPDALSEPRTQMDQRS